MNGNRNFIIGLLIIGLMVSTVQAAAPVFSTINPSVNPNSYEGVNQIFSVDTNQTMDFIWYIDGAQDGSTSSATTSTYSNNTANVGEYNVTVIANNSNGTIFNKWTWTVNTPPEPGIINPNPSDTTVTTYNGSSKTFNIEINQTANVTWYRENILVQTNLGVSSSSYANTSPIGTYNITANVENQNGKDSITWNWSVVAIPPPSITPDPTSNPESEIGQNKPFSITIDQPVNITWFMNGSELKNETLKVLSSYSNNTAPIGTYNITVNVENVNGTDTTTWIWSVVPIPVDISNPVPTSSTPSTIEDETITFSINISQKVEVKWYIDDAIKQTNASPITSASFTTSKSAADTYTVKATATNTTTSASKSQTWTWKVDPKTFYFGDRIWDDMSKTYTWNPQSFSGFYYDLDTNIGGETLTIQNIGRSLSKGEIIYETSPIPIKFEYGSWGTYDVVGFMADRYFAGYNVTDFASSADNLLDKRKLSKVLTDNDKRYSVKSGSALKLEEGYEFRITEFSSSGTSIMVGLFKDGGKVKEDIISEGRTFVYEKDLGTAKDMPIIAIHIETVFTGMETSTVIVEGIFQISENYIDVDRGDKFGEMEVTSVSSTGITMKNEDSVSLGAGDDFNLMGKINIIVGDDSDTLRFAPYVDMSEPGTYELRGTVTEEAEFDWTPLNFEALLYDMDTGDGDEILRIERDSDSDKTIDANDLTYTTNPIEMNFEHSSDEWKTYQSIGFMGDTYFAGYIEDSSFISSDRSLIEEGKLSKVLIDEDKRYTLHIGNSLPLQEGYSVRIDEISRSGEALMFTILKDGKEISTDISSGDDTFVYEVEVGDTDIPIFIVHIDQVFSGMETNSVFIDGIFQISEKFTTVEKGDSYGIMEVTSTTSSSIVMANKDSSITLGQGDTISIMSDIKIKVADSGTVRFYPFQEIVVEEPLYLELDIPGNVYQNEELTIKVTSDGDAIKGAAITFGDTSIGTTDSSGELTYTHTESGIFTITASMEGYVSDEEDIEVLYQPEILLVSAPLLSDSGESIVISVTSEGAGVNGASVKFGSKDLGTTPASGNITHTPDEVGTFTISASKSGYQDATKDIDITDPAAKLVFSNLTIKPKIVEPGENVNITVEASNFGTLKEAQTMYLKVNGEDVVSQDLVLDPGEIVTIHFNMNKSKSGTYLVEVDGRSDTFRVTGLELSSTSIFVAGIIAILSTTAIIYSISQGTLTMDIISAKVQAFEKMLRHLIEK